MSSSLNSSLMLSASLFERSAESKVQNTIVPISVNGPETLIETSTITQAGYDPSKVTTSYTPTSWFTDATSEASDSIYISIPSAWSALWTTPPSSTPSATISADQTSSSSTSPKQSEHTTVSSTPSSLFHFPNETETWNTQTPSEDSIESSELKTSDVLFPTNPPSTSIEVVTLSSTTTTTIYTALSSTTVFVHKSELMNDFSDTGVVFDSQTVDPQLPSTSTDDFATLEPVLVTKSLLRETISLADFPSTSVVSTTTSSPTVACAQLDGDCQTAHASTSDRLINLPTLPPINTVISNSFTSSSQTDENDSNSYLAASSLISKVLANIETMENELHTDTSTFKEQSTTNTPTFTMPTMTFLLPRDVHPSNSAIDAKQCRSNEITNTSQTAVASPAHALGVLQYIPLAMIILKWVLRT